MNIKVWLIVVLVVGLIGVYGIKKYVYDQHSDPAYLYKIVSVESWEQSQGQDQLVLSDMDREFIHLATEKQIARIVEKFWKDAPAVVVVKVDTQKLPGTLVLEANPGGSTKFYHLYDGFIPQEAVVEVKEIVTK